MKKFLILLFLGGAIVLASYLVSYRFGLASQTAWRINNLFHFLGGIYAFFFVRFVFNISKKYHNTITAPFAEALIFICGALVMGVLWEWLEFFFVYWNEAFSLCRQSIIIYADTLSDLALDLFGAISAGLYHVIVNNEKNK